MGTHHKGTPEEVAALDAYIKLMRCAESLTARLQPGLDRAGLTVSRFGVLEALHHLGPMRSSQLAKKILKTGGNLTLVVRNLERDGLVRRERDRSDSRAFRIHLTAAGERLISRVFAEHLRNVVNEFSAITLEEQAELAKLCKKLGRSASHGKP